MMTTAAPIRDYIIVWYQLVDAQGDPYNGFEVIGIRMSSSLLLQDFCEVVVDENKNELARVDATDLKVFASLEAFHQNEELEVDQNMSKLTTAKATPLYMVVPSIELSQDFAKKRQKYEFEEVPLTFHPISEMPSVGDVVTITRSEGSITVDMPLYIRPHLVEKFHEMKENFESTVLLQAHATGPEGCGKTCFFWMWAMMKMQEGKRLLFVQYRKRRSLIWILEDKKLKRMKACNFLIKEYLQDGVRHPATRLLKTVEQILIQQTSKFDFAILDGVQDECDDLVTVMVCCTGSDNHDKISKSVFVTRAPFNKPDGYEPRGNLFNEIWDMAFDSWNESDYDQAVESQFMVQSNFARELLLKDWKLLKTNVDQNEETLPALKKIKQAVKLKYGYAGGCARYMFEYSFSNLEKELNVRR